MFKLKKLTLSYLVILCLIGFLGQSILTQPAFAKKEINDQNINNAIESELIIDPMVFSNNIDVNVTDGIVTLSGMADNLLSKERSAEIAQTIKGVRSVVNEIQVKATLQDDATIKNNVINALVYDPATDSYEVEVTVTDGVVGLSGTVDSWQEKQLCADVVKGVKGVVSINNMINIEYPEERLDTEIQAEIKRRLDTDVWIDGYLIDANVDNGKVTLDGAVGSVWERYRASSKAWVNGVKSVDDSNLKVQWILDEKMQRADDYTNLTDKEIEAAIEDAFLYDSRVFSFKPEVSVEFGVVTLTGVVENFKAKKAAEQDAKNTQGVIRVKNYLKVRPENVLSDNEIEKRIQNALTWDPIVDRYQIVVSVTNGVVRLNGVVDTKLDKLHAEDVAARVNSVVAVDNNLDVRGIVTAKRDWEIKQDIADELFWNPYINRNNITISVENGVVTLTGEVDRWREVWAATTEAYEGGAFKVFNKLTVKNHSLESIQ